MSARYSVDWSHLSEHEVLLRRALATDVDGIAAFHALLLPVPCSDQLRIISMQTELLVEDSAVQLNRIPFSLAYGHTFHRAPSSPLSIALLRGSANANVERLAALMSLEPGRFSVHLLTTALDSHSLTRLRQLVAGNGRSSLVHISLAAMSNEAAARLLSGYDAVLDASGHTAGNRLAALARRPAPLATSVLGFPASYGGGHLVDYLTADRTVLPPVVSCSCVAPGERLALLPATYQVSPAPSPHLAAGSTRPPMACTGACLRGRRGWPPLLLGSFTRSARWHPSSFELWMATLLRTTSTALWLLVDHPEQAARVMAEMASAGIRTRRVVLSAWEPNKETHLARHRYMAVCVDTTPLYGSHTTAADALGSGAPLLSVPSEVWSSRVGASVSSAIGVMETISASRRDLVDLAEALLDGPGGGGCSWQRGRPRGNPSCRDAPSTRQSGSRGEGSAAGGVQLEAVRRAIRVDVSLAALAPSRTLGQARRRS